MNLKYLNKMKIKTIHIDSFKNIINQSLNLSEDKYTTLIGTNGSGKSNWLEAISSIFLGLRMKQPNDLKYNMTYSLNGETYSVSNGIIESGTRKIVDIQQILPDKIIACYSGEDQRLWNNFYKPHYDKFFNAAIKNVYQEPEMIYINKYHWIIALISLLCSERPEIKHFISRIFNIEGEIDRAQIPIHINFNPKNIVKFKQTDAANFVKKLQTEDDLRISHIASYEIGAKDNNEYCRKLYFYLYLLSLPKTNNTNKVSKAIEGIDISINGYNIDSLSEGHKKLILIKFITSIIGTENSLILFDEPDAHTHIASKRDILTSIQDCPSQTILTTHSPVFIDMMNFDNLRYLESGTIIDMTRIKAITQISDGNINVLEGALIAASKNIVITEGPDNIFHIKSAITAISTTDNIYHKLENISFLFMGGAKEVENYYNEIIKSIYDTITTIVFVFDFDEEGREGAKMVQKLIASGNNKLKYVFYHKKYPVPTQSNLDFYLEDFFDRSAYNDVQLPNFNGIPSFAELKKASTWANSIKKRIQKHKRDNTLTTNDYNGFKEFLNQLIISFRL